MKKKQKIKGIDWLFGWKQDASHAQVLKAAVKIVNYARAARQLKTC